MSYPIARRLFAVSRLPLLALGLSLAIQPAVAQSGSAASVLARNVRTLASDPKNFDALIAAGNAAVAVGDLDAALGFFGRADEIRPQDWRQKAGMGAASVQRGDVTGAMGWFTAAERAGAKASDLGADRGMALDLLGRQAEAQADYRAALPVAADGDEVRRRLALSLAIGGDRGSAVQILRPQLERRDPAGMRTHAFVLALTGDAEGARAEMEQAMPGSSAGIGPFFAQLSRLVPTQKAAAVHLGVFPDQPQFGVAAVASNPAPVLRAAPQAPSRKVERDKAKSRSRSQQARVEARPAVPVTAPTPPQSAPAQAVAAQSVAGRPFEVPSRARKLIAQTEPGAESNLPMARPNVRIVRAAPAAPASSAAPTIGPAVPEDKPDIPAVAERMELPRAVETVEMAAPREERGDEQAAQERLAGLDAVIAAAPPPAAPVARRDRAAERKAAQAKAKSAAEEKARKAEEAARKAKAEEERKAKAEAAKLGVAGTFWVQLAGGSNEASMAREYKKLQGKAKTLKGRAGYVTQGKDYYRLVVGPFKTSAEGSTFVTRLKKDGVSSFVWTRNPAQLPIERAD